jgi:hypothetical protein
MHKLLKVIEPSLNPQIHDLVFRMRTLFDPIVDSFEVSMNVVLHPTHSLMPLHTQMIIGNFLQSPQPHQYWCFLPPPNLPLVHGNLEMQTNTQTWVVYLL